MRPRRGPSLTDALGACFAIGCVLVVTVLALHPTLLLANTTTAGGHRRARGAAVVPAHPSC